MRTLWVGCALVQLTLCPNCMSARCQQWAQVELLWLLYQVPSLAISCPWLLAAGIVLRAVWPPAPLAQLHPSIFSLSWQQSGHSPHCWPQPQQDVELSICVCISECMHFCSFFPLLFFLWFWVLADFFTSQRIWKGHEIFFFSAWFSVLLSFALSLSHCACCGFSVIDFICCCSWHQS